MTDYVSKLAVQLAGNDQPDMGWMLESPALGWEDAGALVDLAPYLTDESISTWLISLILPSRSDAG